MVGFTHVGQTHEYTPLLGIAGMLTTGYCDCEHMM